MNRQSPLFLKDTVALKVPTFELNNILISTAIETSIEHNEESDQQELVSTVDEFLQDNFSSDFERNRLFLMDSSVDQKPHSKFNGLGDSGSANEPFDNRLGQLVAASQEPGFAGLGSEDNFDMNFEFRNSKKDTLLSASVQQFDPFLEDIKNGSSHASTEKAAHKLPKHQNYDLRFSDMVISPSEIKDVDVLLERGGKGNRHRGSKYYRHLINKHREGYQSLPESSKAAKMKISFSVVLQLKETGARFIHKQKGIYYIINDRRARNKVSQALREKNMRLMTDSSDERSV